jgi:hypothetical protein
MPFNAKHTTFTVRDGGGLSQSLGPGTGTISIPGLTANSGAEVIDIRDRMSHYAAITGPEATYEFTTEVIVDAGSLAANAVLSAIRRSGTWAAATSIETKTDAYLLRLDVTLTDSLGRTTTIVLGKCKLSADFVIDDQYTKFTISGTCYTLPTIT